MEVGLRCVDGEQRQEMGRGEAIAAFVDVAAHREARKIGDPAVEQGGGRHDKCHVPTEFSVFQRQRVTTVFAQNRRFHQRRPTIGRLHRFCRGCLAVVTVFALRNEQRTSAVTFDVVVG